MHLFSHLKSRFSPLIKDGNTLHSSKLKSLAWLFLGLVSSTACSAANHYYLSGSAGFSRAQMEESTPEINYYFGQLLDAYPLNNDHSTSGVFSLNGGYEFEGAGLMPAIALGVGIYETGRYHFDGQLIETALGSFPTPLYNYKYHLNTTRLMAEAQLSWACGNWIPFINGGIGAAWNHLSKYSESAVSNTGFVVFPPFRSQTNTNFAYHVGAGLSYAYNLFNSDDFKHERIALGYRYTGLGNASFGTRGNMYPYELNMNDLSANELYISYTYLF
jgi:opacity protein-like surface antigen